MPMNIKSPSANMASSVGALAPTMPAPAASTGIVPAQQYDIAAEKAAAIERFDPQELDTIASEMDIYDPNSIVMFGQNVTSELSKVSDTILGTMEPAQLKEMNRLLAALGDIMDEFNLKEVEITDADIEEARRAKKSLFANAKKQLEKKLEKLFKKYETMGDKVNTIYVELCKQQSDMGQSNRYINDTFNACVNLFHNLEKYIVAGEQSEQFLLDEIAKREAAQPQVIDAAPGMPIPGQGDQVFELQTMKQAADLLSRKLDDLRVAENFAMQSIPVLKTLEFSNYNLIRKTQSYFTTTLPQFKLMITNAMIAKKEYLQAQIMAVLDAKANEAAVKSVQNTYTVAKATAKLTAGSSFTTETMTTMYTTIKNGIMDCGQINKDAAIEREERKKALLTIKADFAQTFKTN